MRGDGLKWTACNNEMHGDAWNELCFSTWNIDGLVQDSSIAIA